MKRIIKITKKQLKEIVGGEFSYLDDDQNGKPAYTGDTEVATSDNAEYEEDFIPVTTDKIAKQLVPRSMYGYKNGTNGPVGVVGSLYCSHVHSNSLLEGGNKELALKVFAIPDKLYDYLLSLKNKYKNTSNVKGIKRLTNLIENRYIKTNEMYRLKNMLDKYDDNSTDPEFLVIGGNAMKRWINNELSQATEQIKSDKYQKLNRGEENAFIKNHSKNTGGKIHTEKK